VYRFKLNRVEFNDMTSFAPKEITVLVGPNNSGKSRALKDIVSHVTRRLLTKAQPLVIKDLECSALSRNLTECRQA
jgi:predicted ATP-binding protein involved in virulence